MVCDSIHARFESTEIIVLRVYFPIYPHNYTQQIHVCLCVCTIKIALTFGEGEEDVGDGIGRRYNSRFKSLDGG